MATRILLDISRLLIDAGRPTPTGILRVELAYASHWLATAPDDLIFTAKRSPGGPGLLDHRQARKLIADLSRDWGSESGTAWRRWRRGLRAFWMSLALWRRGTARLIDALARDPRPTVYVVVSHAHLESPRMVRRLKARTGVKFVYFVHDLIPWQFPEFDTPGWAARVERRARNAAELADAILVNSEDTKATFIAMMTPLGRVPPVVVVPLGVSLPALTQPSPAPSPSSPYFVVIGTIEPKKNHLFLLNLWRQMSLRMGKDAPRLILIGKRGWENENAVDMLDRSRAIAGLVEERSDLSDVAVMQVLAGARALLLASFAEGYGLPLAEALSLGLPAICSDLPALREVGGDVPEFIDPLDGPSWSAAIVDYMNEDSPRRRAQLDRLKHWRAPKWETHFARVDALVTHLGDELIRK